jgi:dihydrofolate reductase
MAKIVLNISMTLDGFIAGPNDESDRIADWFFDPRNQRTVSEDDRAFGAIVLGRRSFDLAVEDFERNSPFKAPVFVVTHRPMPSRRIGRSVFHFVDSIELALEQALQAARGKDIAVIGGAHVARQCIAADALDEIHMHLVPVLLGEGIRLFEHANQQPIELELYSLRAGVGVTHHKFRVIHQAEMKLAA